MVYAAKEHPPAFHFYPAVRRSSGLLRLMAFICDESAARHLPGVVLLPIFLHGLTMPTSVPLHILHKEVRF